MRMLPANTVEIKMARQSEYTQTKIFSALLWEEGESGILMYLWG